MVEMEAGPYCCAMYEMSEAARYPMGEPINFSRLPVDFGVIHYASDTPFTQARTLGARGLSYFGMDSTYASSVAILRRILRLEGALVDDRQPLDAPIVEDGDEMPGRGACVRRVLRAHPRRGGGHPASAAAAVGPWCVLPRAAVNRQRCSTSSRRTAPCSSV